MATLDVLRKVSAELQAGRELALCAIVATRGPTPQPVGSLVCVSMSGEMTGTLGGGCAEAEIRRKAFELLCSASNRRKSSDTSLGDGVAAELLQTLDFANDFEHGDGMICGGQMDVAVNILTPQAALRYRETLELCRAGRRAAIPLRVRRTPNARVESASSDELIEYRVRLEALPTLLIAGAGHISRILANMAVPLGFRVAVFDERGEYANARRFEPPIATVVGDIASELANAPIDANTYIVIVTRGHKHDERALAAVLDKPSRYIGMIGSRRKVEMVFDNLRRAGATKERLDRVCAPVGLDIGAVTTEEIALSIVAQLVAVRRAQSRPVVEGQVIVDAPHLTDRPSESGT